MKRTLAAAAIFICATIVLIGGIATAYYNTKSLGFDENVTVASSDGEKITFMDFHIYYDEVEAFLDEAYALTENAPFLLRPSSRIVNLSQKNVSSSGYLPCFFMI